LATDPAHSLADALDVELGAEPTEIDTGLYGQQVDTQRAFESSWREVQHYLREVLEQGGVDPLEAEELTVLPGAEEVLALLELRAQVASGRWDVVVVDCAPTAETLRLLALPEALGWYMNRVFPAQRRVMPTLRPVLSHLVGVPMPPDRVFGAVERLHGELTDVHRLLTDPTSTSVRLVLTPEAVVVAEARRTLTSLSLYGYRVDGVIANRVFPAEGADEWRGAWVSAQESVLAEVRQSFVDLPIWMSSYQPGEPMGADALAAFAEAAYAGSDPLAIPTGEGPMTITRTDTGAVLRIALPFAAKEDVDLARHGDELVVTVGSYRRLLALP